MLEKLKKIFKKSYKFIILLICVIALCAIIEDLFEHETLNLDMWVYKILVQKMRNPYLTRFFKVITQCGGIYCIGTITVLSVLFIKNRKIAWSVPVDLVIITLLNLALKNIVERPRPDGYRLISERRL